MTLFCHSNAKIKISFFFFRGQTVKTDGLSNCEKIKSVVKTVCMKTFKRSEKSTSMILELKSCPVDTLGTKEGIFFKKTRKK